MLFVEFVFFPFFAAVFAVHWLLRRNASRKVWLLAASYAFYAAWDWRFLSLILFSTVVDYVVGLKLQRTRRRRAWLCVSLFSNLGLLAVFKYFNFFFESAVELLAAVGFDPHAETLAIVLPVGISFYTFQTLSYSIDVYRRRLEPTRNFVDLALFVAFFPQLVAGPILRASAFLPQLREKTSFARIDVRAALVLFLIGFIKKACISDGISPWVDRYFASPADFDSLAAWVATLGYAVQIYCDFSGYSDMAIACAALLGYELCVNFDAPYFAGDITAFWQRWHISLSTWLRDYLYIPLGGNRGSRLATYRNLMLTMLLGGLWHGAGWNFVLWGGLHGAALALHRAWRSRVSAASSWRRALRPVSMVATFVFVSFCWIFFRAQTLPDALVVAKAFCFIDSAGFESASAERIWILVGLGVAHALVQRHLGAELWRRGPSWLFACGLAVAVAVVLAFVPLAARPFIYFQF